MADILPGGNRAVLTLANGSRVILDSVQNGTVAHQGASQVIKIGSGQLAYHEEGKGVAIGYNTITTPRGGQYEVTLSDGSKVWLNAASSIRFPTSFSGSIRQVEITGEAYFEVTHSATQPFKVLAAGQIVEDVGTHFNINAYVDEPAMTTTLLEGSIRQAGLVLSKPGQQIVVTTGNGKEMLQKQADLEEVMAWKNGLFEFKLAEIGTVMRSIGRWYNVDIRYEASEDSVHLFTGQLSRDLNVSKNLNILSISGYNFKVEERTIVVLPWTSGLKEK